MPSCSTIFSPVHCSITVSNLSQMLMKRSCEASCSSIQSPIHLCGTPFSMQHCSGIECTTFIIYGVFFVSNQFQNMIILCFCLQFTWAKSFDARLWHSCITLTRDSSIQLFLLFKPVFFSQAISTRCRTISMFPVTPFTINWKIFWVVNFLAISYRTV